MFKDKLWNYSFLFLINHNFFVIILQNSVEKVLIIKKIVFSLFVLMWVSLFGSEDYNSFIKEQIEYVNVINKISGATQDVQKVIDAQKLGYEKEIEIIIVNKDDYFVKKAFYESKIFALKKMIKINKRVGSTYAVLRDEVKIKSYKLLMYQNEMLLGVFTLKDNITKVEFDKKLTEYVVENQLKIQKLLEADYNNILDIKLNSRILNQAQKNIKEFNALTEINKDIVNYLYIFEDRIFKLKKYANYHLAGFVISINNIALVSQLDKHLHNYNLSVIKLVFIFISILLIYLVKFLVYMGLEVYLVSFHSLKDSIKEILVTSKSLFGIVTKVINLNLIAYIYNDFYNPQIVVSFFNILYVVIFTTFIYRLLNIYLTTYIKKVDEKHKEVKHEVVNIGIKTLNALVVLVGLLIVLYLGGVDLTAVLSGLGIGGLAVALASKDSLANFFGTLSILLSDVFSQGDWIEVDSKEGVVVEIGLRITTIRTFDNALISIPNATFANQNVVNWNKRTLGRRIKMKLGVRYDSKVKDIQNAVVEIREMLEYHPKIASKRTHYHHNDNAKKLISQDDYKGVKKTLLVYLDSFEDSSINILVYCFAKTVNWEEWLQVKEEVMYNIMDIFEKNEIEFAYNSLSIYDENSL